MRTVSLRLADLPRSVIPIGFVNENLRTQVRFDCKMMFEEYPDAIPTLSVKPSFMDGYPVIVSKEGDIVTWDVLDSSLTKEDVGELQLTFTVGEVVAKSYVGKYRVTRSIMSDGEIPTPIQEWITIANGVLKEVNEALEEIPQTVDEKILEVIDDTAGAGDTDKVWSADKLTGNFAEKADKANPLITGSLAFDEAQNEATGRNSVALGEAVNAIGNGSVALGTLTKASGSYSLASGRKTTALGSGSHSEGRETIALGNESFTAGRGTVSTWSWQHVFGEYNIPDNLQVGNEWESYHNYIVGNSAYRMVNGEKTYYVCIETHRSSFSFDQRYWAVCNSSTPYTYFLEIVGNGYTNDGRSNGRTLDHAGNERLKGNLYVECNADSTGGTRVAKITDIPEVATTAETQAIITEYEVSA